MAASEICVIVPTFNERSNVRELVNRIGETLDSIDYEIIYVDDNSPDGTAEEVFRLSQSNPRLRGIKRVGRRGLSSACIEGMCATGAEYLAVIDGDLQHDESKLREMWQALRENSDLDVAVGTRFSRGGSTGALSPVRTHMSRFATQLGSRLIGAATSDPMSGFFMVRRSFFDRVCPRLSGVGFKILLDLLASSENAPRIVEIPYTMRARHAGESKLDNIVLWHYLVLLGEKSIGKIVPIRFIFFVFMGLFGAAAHLLILGGTMRLFGAEFIVGQSLAVFVAMTVNFFFNNLFTYRDKRLRGVQLLRGLLVFYVACSFGAAVNLALAQYLYRNDVPWYLSGLLGAAVGAVWNFALTYYYAWGRAT